MFYRILIALGVSAIIFSFASFAWANIQDDFATSLDPMWWGLLTLDAVVWLGLMKMIFTE